MNDVKATAWSPLKIPVFRALWLATLASNVGTWMHDIGAGWLMTRLDPSPVMVAMVQAATTLPIFMLALPAGALSDIVDRRLYLIVMQVYMAAVAVLLAVVALTGLITPWLLLTLTFAMGIGAAMMLPAWAAITPELVPRSQLPSAIALNSMGINVARAIGPAVAGYIISFAGTSVVFALNALSFAGVIMVLSRWERETVASQLPAERLISGMRSGLRFARYSPELQAAVMRGVGFFLFASAAWALLPLVAKYLINGGPKAYGILVGAIGVGAVVAAFILPSLRRVLSRDALVGGATLLYAGCLLALATLERIWPMALAMAISGMAWLTVLSTLQVAAQMALPNWVRSRGLAVFMSLFMGSMALGSLIWGKIASISSIEQALTYAAVGAVISVFLTRRWHISGADDLDLTPSMHWPAPPMHEGVEHDRGPVLVSIEYSVRQDQVPLYLELMTRLGKHRRRDGAFAWRLFEHAGRPHHYIETFSDESWLAHLRSHERVTGEVRDLQARIQTLLVDGSEPQITHYIAPKIIRSR